MLRLGLGVKLASEHSKSSSLRVHPSEQCPADYWTACSNFDAGSLIIQCMMHALANTSDTAVQYYDSEVNGNAFDGMTDLFTILFEP